MRREANYFMMERRVGRTFTTWGGSTKSCAMFCWRSYEQSDHYGLGPAKPKVKGDSHQIWRTQRVQVNVASLRLFLRSSTGPNRALEPQSLGGVCDPVRIAEGPTHDFGFSILDFELRTEATRVSLLEAPARGEGFLVDSLHEGERPGPRTLWYLGNVDGPRCHANQVVPATGLVDDAITTARKKGIVDQAGKPDLLPCRGNGFPAIRRRLTHGRVRYNSSCKNLPVSNSLQNLMPNSQGFLQVLADVPERSSPSGSSDCFVATFNANPEKSLRIIFQAQRGCGTQNALGRASQSDSFVCADHDDEVCSRPMATMCSPSVSGGRRCCELQPRDSYAPLLIFAEPPCTPDRAARCVRKCAIG